MKKIRRWILMSIFVCSVLAFAYPVYAALDGKTALRSTTPECPKSVGTNLTLIPNPDDCRSYWECYNGIPVAMRCPEGLYFCSQHSMCAWIFQGGCLFNDCVIVSEN